MIATSPRDTHHTAYDGEDMPPTKRVDVGNDHGMRLEDSLLTNTTFFLEVRPEG
jgi:hypothetical protein